MMTHWSLDCTKAEFISEEVGVPVERADRLVKLFEEGNEIAYVSRYRVDAHGGMSCEQVRKVYEVMKEANDLNKKVEKAIVTVHAKAGDEAADAIQKLKECRDVDDVTEITKAYSSGRRTKAGTAKALGLQEAASKIHAGETVNIRSLVKKSEPELASVEKVEEHLGILMADLINKEPATISKAKEIARLETHAKIMVKTTLSAKSKKEECKESALVDEFKEVIGLNLEAKRIANHVLLRIRRGEEKGVLIWTIEVSGAERCHPSHTQRVSPSHTALFHKALSYSISKLFIPKIQRAVKRFLWNRAEHAAIDCFAKNLGQLFSQEGIKEKHIVALDPGFAACKAAFLSPDGSVIETRQLSFRNCQFDQNGTNLLKEWARHAGCHLIFAVGNGTASSQTQKALQDLIARRVFGSTTVHFCVVDECGASKYSITPLAEEELPGMPVTEKSAVSIGRRLIDPVSEFVKIEPRHLGIGMYQHSVNEKKLTETLELVVRDSVSIRGVDVNVASLQLLQHVCGLNKKTANGIITMRQKKGRIISREELKSVAGLGPKAFQQAAGFLRVCKAENDEGAPPLKKKKSSVEYEPLDSTVVHPDNYDAARAILKRAGLDVEGASIERGKQKLRMVKPLSDEEKLVLDLLTSSPKTVPPPSFVSEILKLDSLHVGQKIVGRVTNVTDFGAFFDIGAEKGALGHIKHFRQGLPEVGTKLEMKIDSVDVSRQRISVRPA